MIMNNLPYDQAYEPLCFGLDYPPLFGLFQAFWGYILAYLSPEDMHFNKLFKESSYFLILLRFSVIITDFVFFFSVLYLFRTFQRGVSKDKQAHPIKYNVLTFCVCFLDVGLLAIDNGSTQYNSLIFSLVILSALFMYKKRMLISAVLYCLSILTKHITFYYSFGYVALLLLTYCLTIHKDRIQINFMNSAKLAGVVFSTIGVVLFPYRYKLKEMSYLLFGGVNMAQIAVPNFQFLLTFIEVILTGWYTRSYLIPTPITILLLLLTFCGILYLAFKQRNLTVYRLPAYMFISACAFVNFMKYVHEKHLLYMWLPLMIYSLSSDPSVFLLMVELKCFNAFANFNMVRGFDALFTKHPLLLCNLLLVKHLIPSRFRVFFIFYLIDLLYDLMLLFVYIEFQPRFVYEVIVGIQLYYRIIRHLIKTPFPSTPVSLHSD